MTWEKLKEKIEERIVIVVFGLVAFLCLVIWQAIPSEAWARLGAIIPKRALAALIGLLLIGLATLGAWIFSLKQKLKLKNAEPPAKQFIKRFTIKWDENLEPHCPVCDKELAQVPLDDGPIRHFRCIPCNQGYWLVDEIGKHLTLPQAKELLSPHEPSLDMLRIKAPEYAPDEIDMKILALLAKPQLQNIYAVEIANTLHLHPTLVDVHLHQLEKEQYVRKTRPDRHRPHVYYLTPKGKEFAVNNNLLDPP